MADLSVNFAGIKSPHPFWLASAPPPNMGNRIHQRIPNRFDLGSGNGKDKGNRICLVFKMPLTV
jgi:hypothetical protein